jgi:hypothetical protein
MAIICKFGIICVSFANGSFAPPSLGGASLIKRIGVATATKPISEGVVINDDADIVDVDRYILDILLVGAFKIKSDPGAPSELSLHPITAPETYQSLGVHIKSEGPTKEGRLESSHLKQLADTRRSSDGGTLRGFFFLFVPPLFLIRVVCKTCATWRKEVHKKALYKAFRLNIKRPPTGFFYFEP